jgi:RND superfamily putative drug exporter
MSAFLERLGRWCARHPWRTIGAWFVIAALVLVAGSAAKGFSENNTIPHTESQTAIDLLQKHFPAQAGATTQVVLRATSGTLADRAHTTAITEALARVKQLPGVTVIVPPSASTNTLSRDGTIGYAIVNYSTKANDVTKADFTELEAAMTPAKASGVQIEYSGDVAQAGDPVDLGNSEIIGLVAAVIVLLVAFGSLVAMGLPIGTALIALVVGTSLVKVLTNVLDIASVATIISTMIGLGVGIDYALFVVTRHREQLASGMSVHDSAGRAIGTSGMAVLFAGTTVVIAICGLALAGIPMVATMGYASAVVVAVSVVAALTLLPAFLGLSGTRINSIRLPWVKRSQVEQSMHPDQIRRGLWARWATHVARHPWRYLLASLGVLLALAAPMLSMRLGQTDDGTLPTSSTQRRAYDLLGEGFGKGFNGPLILSVEVPATGGKAAVARVVAAVKGDRDVAAVAAPQYNDGGDVAVVRVLPKSSPQDHATSQLVSRLRHEVVPAAVTGTNAHVYVGGETAAFIDISNRISSRLPYFIAAVVALSFLLLMVVFRSVLVPLKAAIMNVLSIGAAYGVIVAVFQWGWLRGLVGVHESLPIVSFIPMMMFAILFGLSMDYEVFLLSRVREEWLRTGDAKSSVPDGLAATARVITSAALIMICVFAGFVLVKDPTVKMFGLGLATAVFIDATVIRMVLVPATMELLGRANWWLPEWLDRILPHLDLEVTAEPVMVTRSSDEDDDLVRAAS